MAVSLLKLAVYGFFGRIMQLKPTKMAVLELLRQETNPMNLHMILSSKYPIN